MFLQQLVQFFCISFFQKFSFHVSSRAYTVYASACSAAYSPLLPLLQHGWCFPHVVVAIQSDAAACVPGAARLTPLHMSAASIIKVVLEFRRLTLTIFQCLQAFSWSLHGITGVAKHLQGSFWAIRGPSLYSWWVQFSSAAIGYFHQLTYNTPKVCLLLLPFKYAFIPCPPFSAWHLHIHICPLSDIAYIHTLVLHRWWGQFWMHPYLDI